MPDDAGASYCKGCGRSVGECEERCPCDRSGPGDPHRFCTRCGWRLRTIVVVPGVEGLWCRTHGVIAGWP